MSRAIIGGVVTAVIVALTITAYVITTSRLEKKIENDVTERVFRAQRLLVQNSSLTSLSRLKRVEVLAKHDRLMAAARAEEDDQAEKEAKLAFADHVQGLSEGEPDPDIMAFLNADGDMVAMLNADDPLPDRWKEGGDLVYPSLELALERRQYTAELWVYEGRVLMRVGVAPVVDDTNEVVGVVVIGHPVSADDAQEDARLLGTDVAFFYGDRVFVSSFRRGGGEEATEKQKYLGEALEKEAGKPIADRRLAREVISIEVGGEQYLATAAPMHPISTKELPPEHPTQAAGAMALMSLGEAMDPIGSVRWAMLLLGVGAVLIALLGLVLTSKRILAQVDEIEIGINEIINGNLDRTFRPVGEELDGLANGLNVMLARLLGRPEPGEEEFDEQGNPVQPGRVDFDTGEMSAKDEAALALAQEPEPDYYKRLYEEFVAAKQKVGEATDNLNFDSFVAKLRLNEGNLKSRYECDHVRFKVVVTDADKVTLKPVPIR